MDDSDPISDSLSAYRPVASGDIPAADSHRAGILQGGEEPRSRVGPRGRRGVGRRGRRPRRGTCRPPRGGPAPTAPRRGGKGGPGGGGRRPRTDAMVVPAPRSSLEGERRRASVADDRQLSGRQITPHPPFPPHPSPRTRTLSLYLLVIHWIKRMISVGEQSNATIRKRRTNARLERVPSGAKIVPHPPRARPAPSP